MKRPISPNDSTKIPDEHQGARAGQPKVITIPPMSDEEAGYRSALPRSMEGEGLTINAVRDDGRIVISDEGGRAASYVFYKGQQLKGRNVRIVPGYTEAGYFMETNIIKLSDGERTGFYTPEGSEKWH